MVRPCGLGIIAQSLTNALHPAKELMRRQSKKKVFLAGLSVGASVRVVALRPEAKSLWYDEQESLAMLFWECQVLAARGQIIVSVDGQRYRFDRNGLNREIGAAIVAPWESPEASLLRLILALSNWSRLLWAAWLYTWLSLLLVAVALTIGHSIEQRSEGVAIALSCLAALLLFGNLASFARSMHLWQRCCAVLLVPKPYQGVMSLSIIIYFYLAVAVIFYCF